MTKDDRNKVVFTMKDYHQIKGYEGYICEVCKQEINRTEWAFLLKPLQVIFHAGCMRSVPTWCERKDIVWKPKDEETVLIETAAYEVFTEGRELIEVSKEYEIPIKVLEQAILRIKSVLN